MRGKLFACVLRVFVIVLNLGIRLNVIRGMVIVILAETFVFKRILCEYI